MPGHLLRRALRRGGPRRRRLAEGGHGRAVVLRCGQEFHHQLWGDPVEVAFSHENYHGKWRVNMGELWLTPIFNIFPSIYHEFPMVFTRISWSFSFFLGIQWNLWDVHGILFVVCVNGMYYIAYGMWSLDDQLTLHGF